MLAPPFRYVGGKSWLLAEHGDLLPTAEEVAARGGTFRSTFLGGAAVELGRFAGRCPCAFSDVNGPVLRAYRTLRDHPEALLAALAYWAPRYSKGAFHAHRAALRAGNLRGIDEAVSVFIILAWGYNGLWRVSRRSGLNTPMGRPSAPGRRPKLFDADNLRACAAALQGVPLREHDFEVGLACARRGDLVYLDPVYEPVSVTANFTGYAGTWRVATSHDLRGSDLGRLVAACERLDARGVQWALSNADTEITRRAFTRKGWRVHSLLAARSVNSKATKRGPVPEILVVNY